MTLTAPSPQAPPPISIAIGDGTSVRLIVGETIATLTPQAASNLAAALNAFAEIARLALESESGEI